MSILNVLPYGEITVARQRTDEQKYQWSVGLASGGLLMDSQTFASAKQGVNL